MVTIGAFWAGRAIQINKDPTLIAELEKKKRLDITEMKKSKKEINSEIKQLIIIGKLHCDECEKPTPIEWEEWVCDYSCWKWRNNTLKEWRNFGKEHPLNEDGESVCSDEICNPRDEEVTFTGMDIDEATKYILQKEVHPRCAECGSLYGW